MFKAVHISSTTKRNIMKAIILFSLMSVFSLNAYAFQEKQLYGTWCFYEQEGFDTIVKESVTITFKRNGTYKWSEKSWSQTGQWAVSDNRLIMSNVGVHQLVSVSSHNIEMTRMTTMRMKKGLCRRNR